MKYDNYTLYGIHSKTERQLLIGYNSIIFVSSLIGDTLILIGSLRYNAIKLHKIMVVFIQYIAVADLLLSIFRVLPGAVSLAANEWILGDFFCSSGYFVTCSFGGTVCYLISALALAKFLIVKYPLRALHFSKKTAHLTTLGIWVCCTSFPTVALIKDEDGAYFSYLDYNCDYFCSDEVWEQVEYAVFCIAIGVAGLIATAVTIVSSAMLIVIAKRVTDRGPGGLQWQGIMIVLLTAAVYCLTILPVTVYYMCNKFVDEHRSGAFHVYFYRYVWYVVLVNMVANFYIYTLTLTSFREFLKSRIRVISAPLTRCFVPNEDELTAQRRERQRLLSGLN